MDEKAPKGEEGGNTRVSGNIWFTPEPPDIAAAYLRAMCGDYEVPEKMVQVWADEMSKNNEWVRSLGGEPSETEALIVEFPDLPGVECVHVYMNKPETSQFGADETLWLLLKDCVENREIRILFATPGKRLVQDPKTKEILGIIAERAGRNIAIRAKKAVVLTCGG